MSELLKAGLKFIFFKICVIVLESLQSILEKKLNSSEIRVDSSEQRSKIVENKIVAKSWIGNLPNKAKKIILDYLDDSDLVRVFCVEPVFKEAIAEKEKSELKLTACYKIKDEDLLFLFQNGFQCQTLDLNHCYWFRANTIRELIRSKHLRELHLIECKIDDELIEQILKLNLNSLSISWCNNWGENLTENQFKDHCFKNLKKLTVFHGKDQENGDFVNNFKTQMLVYCNELQYLKIYECPSQRNPDGNPIIRSSLNFDSTETTPVPKLTHLIINFYRYGDCQKRIDFLLDVIFNKKTIPIEKIDLGENGFKSLLENYAFSRQLQFMKPEEISTVCLSRSPLKKHKIANDYISKAKPTLFEFQETDGWADEHLKVNPPHCNFKKFIMKNAKVNNFQTVADVIADGSKRMEHLDLHGLYVKDFERRYQHFEEGFKKISLCFPQLTFLDLTANDYCLFAAETNLVILKSITNLRALKTLRLPSLIFCELFPDNAQRTRDFKNTSVTAMQKSPLWEITLNCKNIEELQIVSNYYFSFLACPEYTLACIGNLKKLKELHLVNVPTLGINSSFQVITTGCPLLKVFYMKNIFVGTDPYIQYDSSLMAAAIYQMKNIEDLCINQVFSLSKTFIDQLCELPQLKRLAIEKCVATPEVFNHLSSSLLKMNKLVAFCLIHSPKIRAIDFFIKNLKRLENERTAFTYLISSRRISDKSRKNATLFWPAIHEPLRRYSRVQFNTAKPN